MEVDPTPPPTKTGVDYASGIEYDANGAVVRYLNTRVLTKDNGDAYYATPTPQSYHLQDYTVHPNSVTDITAMYIDRFEWTNDVYATYKEYPYHQSNFIDHADTKGGCWAFTSPFTGLRYTGVLPFFSWWLNDGVTGVQLTPRQLWFVEIFNDYMAYRGFAQYDPYQDGKPYPPGTSFSDRSWYGWQPVESFVHLFQTRPPSSYSVVPKIPLTNPVFGDLIWSHFHPDMFVFRSDFVGNPRRNALHQTREERDPDMVPISADYDPDDEVEDLPVDQLWAPPNFDLPMKMGPPLSNTTESYCTFGDWDLNFNREQDPPGTATDGGTFPMYYKDVQWSLIQDRLNRGTNVTGALTRVSGQANGVNVFEVYFNTRDQSGKGFSRYGRVMTGDNLTNGSTQVWQYQSKWLYQTVYDGQPYFRPTDNSWLNIPNGDRCFAGVCWDGTAIANFQSGEWLQNGRGIRAWGSARYLRTVPCKSYATDPTTEFNGVLMLARSKVFEATGRHQCPFTWHSTLGYITYHMMM